VKELHRLLSVLHLLIITDLLLLLIVVINSSRTNAEGSQLGMSQRGIGVGDVDG
jgi:hypothetical protein